MHCTGHQSHEVTTPTVALRKLHCTLAETSITLYCENSIALRDSLKRSQRPLMVLDHLWSLKGLTKRAQQFQAQDNAPSTLPWGSFCPLPTPHPSHPHPTTTPAPAPSLCSWFLLLMGPESSACWGGREAKGPVWINPEDLREGDQRQWLGLLQENFPSEVPSLQSTGDQIKK